MAQKGRNDLTKVIETNVFTNNSKAITAEMLNNVLEDFRDSMFNLVDDKLKYLIYDDNKTLEQHLSSVVGSIPIQGTIKNFDIATGSTGESHPLLVDDGAISSAFLVEKTNDDSRIRVNFKESNANRLIIPVIRYDSTSNWNYANDIAVPVMHRISSKTIELAIRELSDRNQNIDIQLIIL